MEGAVPPCQQLPLAPVIPQHLSQVSISSLPEVLLHSIIASTSSLLDRNNVALTCKGFRDVERATRVTLRVRQSPPKFLPKLGFAGFRNVTELDLSALDLRAHERADFGFSNKHRETVARVLREGLPNVKSLRVRQESFMTRCAVQAWPCMEKLEIQECPRGTEDPFWIDLDWVHVLGKLSCLVELSFIPKPWAKGIRSIREPFEGFIVSLGQSPRQYPSLTALRSCFFATDKVLSVIGKAMPNLTSLDLINNLLDVYYNGNAILTNEGIKHLSTDYPLLTELKIGGDVPSHTALDLKAVNLDVVGKTALRAFCQSQLSSLCLEGPMSLQLGVMVDHLISSRQKKLHLHWSGWRLEESKDSEKLSSVTNLTDVSLGYLAEKEVNLERLRELVLTNKRLSQLELVIHPGGYWRNSLWRDTLGFVVTNARSLVSFTFASDTSGPTILEVVSKLSPARMRLQALKLRLWGVGVVVHSQEDWPALRNLSLEFHDDCIEQQNLGCWLQTCSDLTSLRYQCITRSLSKYSALPFLVSLQSLRHLEVARL
ncbi:hypothetical protein KFL_005070070 [Klebsormidium nitens]|uniref:F-box domain-containing protein n=1 Tax=Klebsormidium nitens TaxID=105231 RepID=A0A1Y1IED3_KLENI|nr:hypothetical protein KFL_005070070 [Klebsormidium nitens]|eukprot:GAQ89290.1 hypothetical protein KFL_005070070 [Klebsormidium nitens]